VAQTHTHTALESAFLALDRLFHFVQSPDQKRAGHPDLGYHSDFQSALKQKQAQIDHMVVTPFSMNRSSILVAFLIMAATGHVFAGSKLTYGEGTVIETLPGLVYVSGFEHRITLLMVGNNKIDVLIPTMGSAPVTPGEQILFSGRAEKIGHIYVVNTISGYVYRHAAKTLQEHLQEQMNEKIIHLKQAMPQGSNAIPVRQQLTPIGLAALMLAVLSGLSLIPTILRARRFNIGLHIIALDQPKKIHCQYFLQTEDYNAILLNIRLIPVGTQVLQIRNNFRFKLGNSTLGAYVICYKGLDAEEVDFPLRIDKNTDLSVYFSKDIVFQINNFQAA
jgi:hypothetical protein